MKVLVFLITFLLWQNIIHGNEECQIISDDVVQFPHESECNLFYKCSNGKKELQTCPKGLLYNAELRVCDWPFNVQCTVENKEWINLDKKIENEKGDSNLVCSQGILQLPHETNCNLFYKCVDEQKIVQICPKGLLYNPELGVCDWSKNVNCKSKKKYFLETRRSSLNENSEVHTKTEIKNIRRKRSTECPKNIEDVVLLPHETNCSVYYHCDKGEKKLVSCPGILLFNSELQVCDWPTNVNCTIPEPVPIGKCPKTECPSTTIYLPDLSDPKKFIRCVDGKEVPEYCPDYLLFDVKLKVCNYEQTAKTVKNYYFTPEPVSIVKCPKIECASTSIYLPDFSDPRKFIRCVDGKEVHEYCPEYLVFDTELKVCNYEQFAKTVRNY